ncbi:MAG: hypothetical protein ABMB14_31615 [Myxococcota bacterium]
MSVGERVATLVRGMDATRHADEIARLQRCRTVADLEAAARDGWLTARPTGERLRLVRHGSGTFLVVAYDDGWTRTLSQA